MFHSMYDPAEEIRQLAERVNELEHELKEKQAACDFLDQLLAAVESYEMDRENLYGG